MRKSPGKPREASRRASVCEARGSMVLPQLQALLVEPNGEVLMNLSFRFSGCSQKI